MTRVEAFVEKLRAKTPLSDDVVDAELVFSEIPAKKVPETIPQPPAELRETALANLVELVLKNQPRLNYLARQPVMQRELIPRLLGIALAGYAAFGVVLAMLFCLAGIWPELNSLAAWLEGGCNGPLVTFEATTGVWTHWLDGSALHLILAYSIGMCAAIGVCLPSFYFYGLLAGLKTSMLQVAAHALKAAATSAIALLGILPIYLAGVLGLVVFEFPRSGVDLALTWGLTLPFVAGLLGVNSLYTGFVDLSDTLPFAGRWERVLFLKRLMVAWCGCFTAVTPVMIYTLWQWSAG